VGGQVCSKPAYILTGDTDISAEGFDCSGGAHAKDSIHCLAEDARANVTQHCMRQ
jgi:hypothetical protein